MPAAPTPPTDPKPPAEAGTFSSEYQLAGGNRLRRRGGLTATTRALARSYAARPAPDAGWDADPDRAAAGAARDQSGRWIIPAPASSPPRPRPPGLPKKRDPGLGLPASRAQIVTGSTPGAPTTNWSTLAAQQRGAQLNASGGDVAAALAEWRADHDRQAVAEEQARREALARHEALSWRKPVDYEQVREQEGEARSDEAARVQAAVDERLEQVRRSRG